MTNYPEIPRKENTPSKESSKQALKNLAYLWRSDDQGWMAKREADWKMMLETVFEDYPKAERKPIEEYFKYGRLNQYVSARSFFFLTPYDSAESLMQLFNSGLMNDVDRSDMYGEYIFDSDRFVDCSWYKRHMSLFAEVVMGELYCEVYEQTSKNHSAIISPPPALWCNDFVRNAIKSLSSKDEWKPIYVCVNYFVTALPYAIKEKQRKRIKLQQLLQEVSKSLSGGGLSGPLLDFVQELKDREQEILDAWDIGEQKIASMGQDS